MMSKTPRGDATNPFKMNLKPIGTKNLGIDAEKYRNFSVINKEKGTQETSSFISKVI